MLFSIIIPTYNRATFLPRLLLGILNQNFSDLEIIVVDDGSRDNTEKSVRSLNASNVIYSRIDNSERAAARNHGLQFAKGTYVNFFDSDDLFLSCFHELADFILKNNSPAVVFGDIQHVDEDGTVLESGKLPYRSFTQNLLHNNFLACGSVFLKRHIALEHLFHDDRRLSSAEDWELWLRIHTQYAFTHFPAPVFKQVHHLQRSLQTIKADKIEIRDIYFVDLVRYNTSLRDFYGSKAMNLFVADRYTFIALAWCSTDKQRARKYWNKAIHTSVRVIRRKRFWAIYKKLLLPK